MSVNEEETLLAIQDNLNRFAVNLPGSYFYTMAYENILKIVKDLLQENAKLKTAWIKECDRSIAAERNLANINLSNPLPNSAAAHHRRNTDVIHQWRKEFGLSDQPDHEVIPPTIDRIKEAHSEMTLQMVEDTANHTTDHTTLGLRHRPYTQSKAEGCYICALLNHIDMLNREKSKVRNRAEKAENERNHLVNDLNLLCDSLKNQ